MKSEEKNKCFFGQIFGMKGEKEPKKIGSSIDTDVDFGETSFSRTDMPVLMKSLSESSSRLGSLSFSDYSFTATTQETHSYRIFVATWNVGGKTPQSGFNLTDFFPTNDQADVYVLGFQEIVPLNAGNVLVIEDNEPAVKWLALINQALNKMPHATTVTSCPSTPCHLNSGSSPTSFTGTPMSRESISPLLFQRSSLKAVSRTYKIVRGRQLKACNCPTEFPKKCRRESCLFRCRQPYFREDYSSEDDDENTNSYVASSISATISSKANPSRYSLITSKQMVGIFVTVWVKRELVQHIGHLRLSCIGRGIMGYLGNKGCISVSMSLHQTTFCFVCSHLASGDKEGDELRRNSDVKKILRHTHFPRICKNHGRRIPEKILDHDRVIWLGDLNYRIALSYSETRKLLGDNAWDALFEKDQLQIERYAGRVFKGWNEGKIFFAPTYKYSNNSDAYAGEDETSKKKRRTPAWCDRILWHGEGIQQLSYVRGEFRFSDHRPVCAMFTVEVGLLDSRISRSATLNMKVGVEELLPPRAY